MIKLSDGGSVVRWAIAPAASVCSVRVGSVVDSDFFLAWAGDLLLACAWAVTSSRSAASLPSGVAVVGLRDWGGCEYEVVEFGPCFADGLPVRLGGSCYV